ncbi:MAG: mechanosensitive ion channel family protein [Sandaracinaceae bacterium]|nr:mechanosensitive ion channel family protein [Sandaracinaceae bacterium]
MDLLQLLKDQQGNLIATGALVVILLVARSIALRAIGRAARDDATRVRWASTARNITLLVFLLGSVGIWATELRTFAISVVAIAAALVLATKELILCVSGTVLRTTAGSFSVGDRVELAGVRGDVIDTSLFTTTILEIGAGHQRTGRSITVPNSVLMSQAVVNETFMDEYVLHVITIPMASGAGWKRSEQALLAAARAATAEHLEPARRFMNALAAKHGLPQFSVEPRVLVALPSPTEMQLVLRLPAPSRDRGRLEQWVLRDYLERMAGPPQSTPSPRDEAAED